MSGEKKAALIGLRAAFLLTSLTLMGLLYFPLHWLVFHPERREDIREHKKDKADDQDETLTNEVGNTTTP